MPSGPRIRTDNVFGTVTDDPLSNVATTLNSAGLANLVAVTGSDYAVITLDPNRVNGAPEIVVVTAHTGSATSATIVRGQFGTSAREHPAGTEWVHGPIASNAMSYVTAADDQGDFVPMNAWESYTPSNTNITVGNGTQVARFIRIGRTIHVRYSLVFGSATAFTGAPRFGLPVAAVTEAEQAFTGYYDDFGTRSYIAGGRIVAGDESHVLLLQTESGAGQVSSTVPFTWTTSDRVVMAGTYEAAS